MANNVDPRLAAFRAQAQSDAQIAGADKEAVEMGHGGNGVQRIQAGLGFDHRQGHHLGIGVLRVVGAAIQQAAAGAEAAVAGHAVQRVAASPGKGRGLGG